MYFTTLTIHEWTPVFQDYVGANQILIDSFQFLVDNNEVIIYAFVIMKDHLHLLWTTPNGVEIIEIIVKFKKFTGRELRNFLHNENLDYLTSNFRVRRKDRKYKIWKIGYGNIEIYSNRFFYQKLNYIHLNPTKGKYKSVEFPESYKYSSARSYMMKKSEFTFLSLWNSSH